MPTYTPTAERWTRFGDIAQLVEQMTFNHWVQGSNPCVSTRNIPRFVRGIFLWIQQDSNPKKGFDPTAKDRRQHVGEASANEPRAWSVSGTIPVSPPEIFPALCGEFFYEYNEK